LQVSHQALPDADQASALNPQPPSVGTLRLSVVGEEVNEHGGRIAACLVDIVRATESVTLPGISIRESRPGWIALALPPLEDWQPILAQLPPEQRQRIQEPAFYDLLHRELSRRYLAMK
jgi:hypothetical protein